MSCPTVRPAWAAKAGSTQDSAPPSSSGAPGTGEEMQPVTPLRPVRLQPKDSTRPERRVFVRCRPSGLAAACAEFPRDPITLAILADVTPQTLQRMQQGARVRWRSVQRVARVLGVD